MKLSKEIKTGLLVTISILILFAGFYFLKGANIFSSQNKYYCYFDNIQGLQVSSMVQIRGMNVGRVAAIDLEEKRVKVTISVNKSVRVTKGTIARLASADLLTGTKVIKLVIPDNSVEVLAKGTDLQSDIEKSLFDNIGDDVSPVITTAKVVMNELDSIVVSFKDVISDKNKQAITNSMASVESATHDIAVLSEKLRNESDRIQNILIHTDTLTANISKTSSQIASAPIKQSIEEMQATVAELHEVINKINSGQGSLGKMVTDKELYNNLNASLSSLDKLMSDLKAHPSRYINLSIFGRKNKE